MAMTEREMQDLATNILKSNGCGWDGRKEVDSKQTNFERKMKPSPMGGQPPRR